MSDGLYNTPLVMNSPWVMGRTTTLLPWVMDHMTPFWNMNFPWVMGRTTDLLPWAMGRMTPPGL